MFTILERLLSNNIWLTEYFSITFFSDDPEIYQGAPISLQLVGRRYEDEKVIEALEYITEQIKLPFTPIG